MSRQPAKPRRPLLRRRGSGRVVARRRFLQVLGGLGVAGGVSYLAIREPSRAQLRRRPSLGDADGLPSLPSLPVRPVLDGQTSSSGPSGIIDRTYAVRGPVRRRR